MTLIRFLFRTSWATVVFLLAASLVSGLSSLAVVSILEQIVESGTLPGLQQAWFYIGLCLAMLIAGATSQLLTVSVSQKAIYNLRQELIGQILAAPLRKLEEVGPARLLVTLTEDINTLSQAIAIGPMLFSNIVLAVAVFAYLLWIAPMVILTLAAVLVVGMLAVVLPIQRASKVMERARERQDTLFGHFRGLTEGIKELKLHRYRRAAFLSEGIEPAAKDLMRDSTIGLSVLFMVGQWVTTLFYLFLGLLFFVLPTWLGTNVQSLIGALVVLLFLIAPMTLIVGTLPMFGQAGVVLDKLKSFGFAPLESRDSERLPVQPPAPQRWQRIELADVTHSYYRERENDTFALGPISLAFTPGELVFLVGGNGSGKTTLAKLITGLYLPEAGEIRLDGRPVDDATREEYRQLFSVVFSDFFLFESLLGLRHTTLDDQAREYLAQLHLAHKVTVENGTLSTISLSQGQRKRLALLTAYLEDRPFYLFDEWAADQDPVFKEVFYRQLLPTLQQRGKTILVISHDDKYFHLADRLLRLDYGRLVEDTLPEGAPPFHAQVAPQPTAIL